MGRNAKEGRKQLARELDHLIRQAANFDLRSGRLDAPAGRQLDFSGLSRPRCALRFLDVSDNRIVRSLPCEFPELAIEILLVVRIVDAALGQSAGSEDDNNQNGNERAKKTICVPQVRDVYRVIHIN